MADENSKSEGWVRQNSYGAYSVSDVIATKFTWPAGRGALGIHSASGEQREAAPPDVSRVTQAPPKSTIVGVRTPSKLNLPSWQWWSRFGHPSRGTFGQHGLDRILWSGLSNQLQKDTPASPTGSMSTGSSMYCDYRHLALAHLVQPTLLGKDGS